MIGLDAKHGSWLAVLNEAAAGGLVLAMMGAALLHLRKGDGFRGAAPALGLGALCALELILRLV
jgi:hypothetical protein